MADAPNAPEGGRKTPIVIDLGKYKRKHVRRLRKGGGKLMDKVDECLDELAQAGKVEAGAQPIIVVVQQKRRGRRSWIF